jgi:hypothetical protein
MVSPRPREEAVLFTACLFSSKDIYEAAFVEVKRDLGNVLFETPPLPWNHSDYYAGEMGKPLFRNFAFFHKVVDTSILPETKLKMMQIEKEFSREGKRRINIDPGYLSLAKVVLSSRKNYSHRIYLGKLVFAELELIFKDGRFHPLPYTYTDYRDGENIRTFEKARVLLKKAIDG